ncbi:protease pro-enzyme activation domain-containing protein [Kitasatospora sp. GP82]|uniref:protease pro-enzyme activation domain-containing protein n=1 Tax=Kitasatospora sp. GP82 TaxID=3035089 RepID=UPI002473FECF|nr:protease pro-enzyme activation domain-containing protein [Kitasatospora sp. GP82]MDH6127605.1 subtilase family serine protease [Kitasatospora sp. GP82]
MRPRSLALASALAVLPLTVASLGATAAYAAPTPNASAARVALPNTVTPAVAHSQKQGDVPAAQQISVAISLKLRNTAELNRFLAAVSTKGAPEFGQYLTPAQFTERFGPTNADVDQVRSYLAGQGLKVTSVSGNRQVVNASGTAAQIAKAFGTHESQYVDQQQNKTFFANDDAASVPASLADVVQGVSGLNNKTVRTTRIAKPNAATPHSTPSGYGPAQYDGAYNLNKISADGTGSTVALWEFDGYSSGNLTTYDSQFGLSGPAVSTVSVDGANYNSAPGQGQGEVELDSEIVRGVAPKATQLVYEAPNSDQGEIDMAAQIVSENKVSAISISWGSCEPDTTASSMTAVDNSFKQAAAQGISIFSASGDDGSRDCTRSTSGSSVKAVDFPASDTYVTGVGGTNLQLSGTGYSSESAWSTAGGGVSTQFAKPSWQTGTGVSGSMRTVPDVSSNADPASGFAIYTAGGWQVYGGTSAAAPLWGGYAALFNQKAKAASQSALGEANPKLYSIANGSSYGSAFHDVASGSNQDFPAKTGYDQVTGWGSPAADGLTTALLGGTTPTPPPTGGCTSAQLLGNGGFENGTSPWTASSGVITNASGEAAHSGSYKAWLDGYGSAHTDTLSQTVTIPAGCKASFSFWLHIDTAETGSTAYDKLTVQAGSTTLATYSNVDAATGYVQKTLDLSAFAGKTVTLKFTGVEDSSQQTSFVIDDTALNIS